MSRALAFVLLALALPLASLAAPPADGTPEAAIRTSLQLIRDGKLDQWITDWCSPTTCRNTDTIESMKRYGLARAQGNAALCLHGLQEDIQVTRVKGDPAVDGKPVTIWIQCEEGRMPAPATLVHADGKWTFTSFSW
jgi:hypothetical protein